MEVSIFFTLTNLTQITLVRLLSIKKEMKAFPFPSMLVGMTRIMRMELVSKLPASYFSVSCECVSGECTRSHFASLLLSKGPIKALIKYFY